MRLTKGLRVGLLPAAAIDACREVVDVAAALVAVEVRR